MHRMISEPTYYLLGTSLFDFTQILVNTDIINSFLDTNYRYPLVYLYVYTKHAQYMVRCD